MQKALLTVATIAIVALAWQVLTGGATAAPGASQTGLLRHVVQFKFKDGTSPDKVREIETAFAALPSKITTIVDFEWGTDVGPEKLANGYSHCFLLTFRSMEDLQSYLPHAAHQEFVGLLKPHLDKVQVVDYFAKK